MCDNKCVYDELQECGGCLSCMDDGMCDKECIIDPLSNCENCLVCLAGDNAE